MKTLNYAIFAATMLVMGCPSSPEKPEQNPPTRSSVLAPTLTSGTPTATASATQAPGSALVGAWEGSFEARKGSVVLSDKGKDKARETDDGKAMTGPGKVEIFVSPNGEIKGKGSGSLGAATLSGKIDPDENAMRATWFPDDPRAPNAMTGVLYGLLKDGVITAEIRVAGPDAMLVRTAKVELKRK